MTDFSLTSANTKPQGSLVLYCKFEVNRDRRTRCTNSWSNSTLKCNANTFVKVDAQTERKTADGLSPICRGTLAIFCKNAVLFKHMLISQTFLNLQRNK